MPPALGRRKYRAHEPKPAQEIDREQIVQREFRIEHDHESAVALEHAMNLSLGRAYVRHVVEDTVGKDYIEAGRVIRDAQRRTDLDGFCREAGAA